GRGLGIATYQGYKSYIAVVAEVQVKDRAITVHKLSCVVDCGLAVDPSSVRQQLAGGLYWGVSTAMMNEVPIDHGTVRIGNYHDYPVARIT
ncbi:molybdopterin cofactor-binding domain-containing protein, partial [Acinetobacter baumannii]